LYSHKVIIIQSSCKTHVSHCIPGVWGYPSSVDIPSVDIDGVMPSFRFPPGEPNHSMRLVRQTIHSQEWLDIN
jgi:hypothetical protein